jgi:hypothetical protein
MRESSLHGEPRRPRLAVVAALAVALTAAALVMALLLTGCTSSRDEAPPPQTTVPREPARPAEPLRQRYVSPAGSDSAPGTKSHPWRTIAEAISAARPGDRIVLEAGVYGARGHTTIAHTSGTASAPITFTGRTGEPKPTILGHFRITGSNLRFSNLLFDGPTGAVKARTPDNPKGEEVEVAIEGDNVELARSEVRDSDWHAGVFISGADQVRIVGNYIHDNGDYQEPYRSMQANHDHGIYFSSGSGLIANNVIEHNLARGVQLYPSPTDVLVTQNTIVRNGSAGVQLGDHTSGSVAANNLIAFNGGSGIRSEDLSGESNLATGNLLWDNAEGNIGPVDSGLVVQGNREARPTFEKGGLWILAPDSPGVDEALPGPSLSRDRRGHHRPLGERPDVGAYEVR